MVAVRDLPEPYRHRGGDGSLNQRYRVLGVLAQAWGNRNGWSKHGAI